MSCHLQAAKEYAELGDLDKVKEVLSKKEDLFPNSSINRDAANSVTNCFMYEQRRVESILKDLQKNGERDEISLRKYADEVFRIAENLDVWISQLEREKNHTEVYHYNQAINAWKSSFDSFHLCSEHIQVPRGMPQRATQYLEKMERLCVDDISYQPSVDAYNDVLHMWMNSQEHNQDMKAEGIFQRMYKINDGNESTLPTPETLRIMIKSWCKSAINGKVIKGTSVFRAERYLTEMIYLHEEGKDDFEPTLEDFLIILEAWGMSR